MIQACLRTVFVPLVSPAAALVLALAPWAHAVNVAATAPTTPAATAEQASGTPPATAPSATPAAAAGGWREQARTEAMHAERLNAMLEQGDTALVVQTFRRFPGAVLPFIDDDLEGGLAIIEEAAKDPALNPRSDSLATARWRRAVKFAELANQAFGEVIFTEYAANFASWTPVERKRFREGQALFRQGRELAKSSPEEALPLLRRSLVIADGLGDYWGVAMTQLAIAENCEKLSRTQEGHDAAVKAIELFGRLQLKPSYVKALTTCARLRQKMEVPDMGSGQLRMALQSLPPEATASQRQALVEELAAILAKLGRKDEVDRLREQERVRAETHAGSE